MGVKNIKTAGYNGTGTVYIFPCAAYEKILVLFLLPCNICAQTPTRLAKMKNPPATKNGISYPSVAE